jgi:hypothetical protein
MLFFAVRWRDALRLWKCSIKNPSSVLHLTLQQLLLQFQLRIDPPQRLSRVKWLRRSLRALKGRLSAIFSCGVYRGVRDDYFTQTHVPQ